MRDALDQPVGIIDIDIAAGFGMADDVVANCFDEEVLPSGVFNAAGLIDGEKRFRFGGSYATVFVIEPAKIGDVCFVDTAPAADFIEEQGPCNTHGTTSNAETTPVRIAAYG
ncbi:MAG: hypothetical protein ACR2PI_04775 [Hyphomicrobiaceae bacterium]